MPDGSSTQVPQNLVPLKRAARARGLIYVSDEAPGLRREKRGEQFIYLAPSGRRITDERVLARIRKLAIPPAYTDVWICRDPRGHLQATGRDARGRKQYRYHPEFRTTRDDGKFARMAEFGARLPQLRRRLRRDLKLSGLPRDKVLAVVVSLLQSTLIRIGSEEYARTNNSFGLTTLRDQHVKFIRDGRASFRFRGKSGRFHEIALNDARLVRLVRHCQELPGQHLFQYVDDNGQQQRVDSGLVNEYLHDAMGSFRGEDFTAKDFRTWGATLRAIAVLACRECPEDCSERDFKRCIVETAGKVAEALGNTPAVCRKSYINPIVFTAWRNGALQALSKRNKRGAQEKLALALLKAATGASRPGLKHQLQQSIRSLAAKNAPVAVRHA
ncbi:MAG: DNA topoisomerase IB [Steroidobacteraceae bacterium]